jgi:hypothetical protein
MKHFTKAERDSATVSFVLNYKPKGMKDVITSPITVKLNDLSNKEFNVIESIISGDKSYKSRKLIMKLNKETNGKRNKGKN